MADLNRKLRIGIFIPIILFLIIFLMPFTVMAAEAEGAQETVIFYIDQHGYSIGDKIVNTDVAPYIKDGRTMAPISFIAQALKAEEIQWIPAERKVVIQKGGKKIQISIGEKALYVNNVKMAMDVAAEIKDVGGGGGRTMLPVAYIAKAFEIGYEWQSKTRSVSFYNYNKVFDKAGVFGSEADNLNIQGNVTVKADGVTLENMTIKGNLIIDKEVGTGSVTLKNLHVLGDTLVRGGGKDSIHIIGGSYNSIRIQDSGDGLIRVVGVDADGLSIVISEGMSGEGVILEGDFQNVRVEGNQVNIQTQGNTLVKNFTVGPGVTGTVISLGNGTTVEKMVLESVTRVTGTGNIQNIIGREAMLKPGITPPSSGGSSGDPLPASKLLLAGSKTMIKAGEAASLTVKVQDTYGNPVAEHDGLIDIITVTDDKGSMTPMAISIPENESQSIFTWSCTQAGIYTLTAAADGQTSDEYEITVEPTAVSEVNIYRDYTDSLMAGEQLEFSASAYDQYGNAITYDVADFSWTEASDGVFTKSIAGVYHVSAEYGDVRSTVETVTVIAGQEGSVFLTGLPTQWTAGQSIDLLDPESGCSIELEDQHGNIVADGQYPVTISDKEGGDKEDEVIFGQGPVLFTHGVSGPVGNTLHIPILLTTAGEHTLTIQAGEAQGTVTVQVEPEQANKFAFTKGDLSITASEQIDVTLEIQDEYGNPTTAHSELTDLVSATGGTISPGIVDIAEGMSQISFAFSCDVSGSYPITAASGSIVPAQCSIAVNPGDPADLNVVPPSDPEVGKDFDLEMSSLMDSSGNILLNGTYHLEISSDREGPIFTGNVAFSEGSLTQSIKIKLNELGRHMLTVKVNGMAVKINGKTAPDGVEVEIIKYDVTGVDIDQGPITIKMEETALLSATIAPANATYPQIIWSSSNSAVAEVNADGIVTGVSKGNTVITATSVDSGFTDTLAVTVDYADICGAGTWESPFVVYTFAGLEKIGTGKYVSYKTTLGPVYYQLGADIDASPTKDSSYLAGKGWKPITSLRMRLDGKGHKISNLMINRPLEDNIGLFGIAETSSISNLTLDNVDITGDEYVGGIAGLVRYADIYNNSVAGKVKGKSQVGGLAGLAYAPYGAGYKYIKECYTTGTVSAIANYAGGLVGSTSQIYEVQNSYSQASVSTGYDYAGGLIGYVSRYGKVTNCYATGSVSTSLASASKIGGLIGDLSTDNTKIVNSYYDKEASGKSDTGKGLPRTTQQMRAGTESSIVDGEKMYTEWNHSYYPFVQIWDFRTETEYPELNKTK